MRCWRAGDRTGPVAGRRAYSCGGGHVGGVDRARSLGLLIAVNSTPTASANRHQPHWPDRHPEIDCLDVTARYLTARRRRALRPTGLLCGPGYFAGGWSIQVQWGRFCTADECHGFGTDGAWRAVDCCAVRACGGPDSDWADELLHLSDRGGVSRVDRGREWPLVRRQWWIGGSCGCCCSSCCVVMWRL